MIGVAPALLLVALGQTGDPEISPRGDRPVAVSVGIQWHGLSDIVYPVPSLTVEWAVLPHLALEARAAGAIIVGDYTGGVKGYLLDGPLSPYATVRVGVYHYLVEGQDPFFAVHAVLGVAWVHALGFELSVEGGGIFQPLADDFYVKKRAPFVAGAVGYRF